MTPSPTLLSLRRALVLGPLTLALSLVWGCTVTTGPADNTNTAAATNTTNTAAQPANTANAAAANTSSAVANNGAPQDFTLVNSTGVEINKLFISPHEKDEWGEDILGRDTLPNGQSGKISFNRDEKAALWDLRIEDTQGDAIEWEKLNLLEISKITLHYENGVARAVTE